MRMRSICIRVDLLPNSKLRAQVYQHSGKTSIAWGDYLCTGASTVEEVRHIIKRAFGNKVRAVWIEYDPKTGEQNGMMQFGEREV